MAKLVIRAPWPGPRGMIPPGEYAIPGQISMTHAKCARADGKGEILREAATDGTAPFRAPPIKGPAPENKGRGGSRARKA